MRALFASSLLLSAALCAPAQNPAASKSAAAKGAPAKNKTPAAPSKGAAGAIGPAAPLPRVYAPVKPRDAAPKYPWRQNITSTIFWIGEQPSQNNPTPNHSSSWEVNWQLKYGGYDDPNKENRTWDFRPKAFTPGLNPFYIALPFNDITNPEVAKRIPWYKTRKAAGARSVCRGVWVAIRAGNKTCFAQWEDCGPWTTNDAAYVFEGKPPVTKENNAAGIDISPAVRDFLGISSGAKVDWRFCADSEVPDGPWKRYGQNNTLLPDDVRNNDEIRQRYQELVRQREEWLKNHKSTAVPQ
jgi:hypothetical protein